MEYKDYYKVLGVDRDATQDDIKRAYRKLARKYHPDVSKEVDAEKKFKEVGEAYEVLKDPEKRAAYDQLGSRYQAGEDFQPPPGWDSGFEFRGGGFTEAGGGFSDFFEELFGRQGTAGSYRRGSYNAKGEDHHARIEVDLDVAFTGGSRQVTLKAPQVDASGHMVVKNRTLNVKIPKGIREGQQIRLSGQGAPGMGQGAQGDLYLEVHFRPHRLYSVEARDLTLHLPVAPWEAALGATVKTPTPVGAVDLKIPAGSQSGKRMRLKGRGIPGDPAGDLYVTLKIVNPPTDDDAAMALYREMAEKLHFNPREKLGVAL